MIGPFDRLLFKEYAVSSKDLGIFRIIFAASLLFIRTGRGFYIADLPDAFYQPPIGPAAFFSGFPPAWLIWMANIIFIVFLTMLLIGWKTKVASLGAAGSLLFINVWVYALGKIDHDIFLIVTPTILAFSGWGDQFSIDSQARCGQDLDDKVLNNTPSTTVGNPAVALLAVAVSLGMFTASWVKLKTGWLSFDSQAVEYLLQVNYYITGRETSVGDYFLRHSPTWLWETQDWATVIIEGLFIVAVVRMGWFRICLVFICFFHIGVLLMFAIGFRENLITYGAFVPWSSLFFSGTKAQASSGFLKTLCRIPPIVSVSLIAAPVVGLVFYTQGPPGDLFPSRLSYPMHVVAGTIAGIYFIKIVIRSIQDLRGGKSTSK